MPFKSNKITYGLPQDEYDREHTVELTNDLLGVLPIEHRFVGIKLLIDKEAYEKCPVPECKARTAYCVMVKHASEGIPSKSRAEHHNCDGATTALGLEKSTKRIESGQEYFSYNLYKSNAVARRLRSKIRSLHRGPADTYGVSICALEDCIEEPDVIICVVNPYQAMRLVQGYEYKTGIKPVIDMGAMQAMCSELTISPYLSGEMNVSVFCPSTRFLCKWEETDMGVAIPFELYEDVVKGVIATVPSYE